jgi:hypothetical protein
MLPVSCGIGGVWCWCSGPVRSINTGATIAADDEDDEDEEDEDDEEDEEDDEEEEDADGDAAAGLSVCGSVYPGAYWWYFRYLVGSCSMSASPRVRSLTLGGAVGPMNTLNLQWEVCVCGAWGDKSMQHTHQHGHETKTRTCTRELPPPPYCTEEKIGYVSMRDNKARECWTGGGEIPVGVVRRGPKLHRARPQQARHRHAAKGHRCLGLVTQVQQHVVREVDAVLGLGLGDQLRRQHRRVAQGHRRQAFPLRLVVEERRELDDALVVVPVDNAAAQHHHVAHRVAAEHRPRCPAAAVTVVTHHFQRRVTPLVVALPLARPPVRRLLLHGGPLQMEERCTILSQYLVIGDKCKTVARKSKIEEREIASTDQTPHFWGVSLRLFLLTKISINLLVI